MDTQDFFAHVLRHASRMQPHPSPVRLKLTSEHTLALSHGLVEQLPLLLSPSPKSEGGEISAVTAALSEVCQHPVTNDAVHGLLGLNEDARRYAQTNELVLTVERNGQVHATFGPFRISRPSGAKHWLLHLPEGTAPAGELWNAVCAAKLCARGKRPGDPTAPLDSSA